MASLAFSATEGWEERIRAANARRDIIERDLDLLYKDPAARRPTSTVGKEIQKLEAELRELPFDYDIDTRFTFTSEEIKCVRWLCQCALCFVLSRALSPLTAPLCCGLPPCTEVLTIKLSAYAYAQRPGAATRFLASSVWLRLSRIAATCKQGAALTSPARHACFTKAVASSPIV